MALYNVKVNVTYDFGVEADSQQEAEDRAWIYEDHAYSATVDSLEVTEIEPDEDNEEEEEGSN
jgi:hypothetical protein